jgi:hypothetical protein
MKTSQPQLPAMPRDWTRPQAVAGSELSAVIAEARAAGWHAHWMKVLPAVTYELQFFRLAGTGGGGKQSKDSFSKSRPAMANAAASFIYKSKNKPTTRNKKH